MWSCIDIRLTCMQAFCAANDTSGNAMRVPASTVLSPPSIMPPLCTASQRCSGAANTTRLSLSMSVNGSVAYIIIPNSPGTSTPAHSPTLPSLTPDQLRAEAVQPDVLLPWMVDPFDETHVGVAEVATPFVRVTVPVNLWNDTTYTLLLAGDYDGGSVPCCHADALQVRPYLSWKKRRKNAVYKIPPVIVYRCTCMRYLFF